MYPKQRRILIVETTSERFIRPGQHIEAVTAGEWRLKRTEFARRGFRIVQQFRLPMRRLAPERGWWGFAVIAMDRRRVVS